MAKVGKLCDSIIIVAERIKSGASVDTVKIQYLNYLVSELSKTCYRQDGAFFAGELNDKKKKEFEVEHA